MCKKIENIYKVKVGDKTFVTSTYKKAVMLKKQNINKEVEIDIINLRDLEDKEYLELC